jgi:hypothetical protein
MNAYPDPAAKAMVLSADQLAEIATVLPSGAMPVGGVYAAAPAVTFADTLPPNVDIEVIYAADDHTIHTAVVHYVEPGHYDITSDVVTGSW